MKIMIKPYGFCVSKTWYQEKRGCTFPVIEEEEKSYIVELKDGSTKEINKWDVDIVEGEEMEKKSLFYQSLTDEERRIYIRDLHRRIRALR